VKLDGFLKGLGNHSLDALLIWPPPFCVASGEARVVHFLLGLKDFTERNNGKYHTPIAEWMHHVLRPLFADQ